MNITLTTKDLKTLRDAARLALAMQDYDLEIALNEIIMCDHCYHLADEHPVAGCPGFARTLEDAR